VNEKLCGRDLRIVKRSRLEVYFDVLEAIDQGTIKPTRIMYKTNLCWTALHDVLNILTSREFIREEKMNKTKRYYITEKGRNALSYYKKSISTLQPYSKTVSIP
jgi:predicted transcriptional regulator